MRLHPLERIDGRPTGQVCIRVSAYHTCFTDIFRLALCSVNGFKPPKVGSGVLIGGDISQPEMKSVAVELQNLGYKLYCSNSEVESFLNSIPYVVSLKAKIARFAN